MNAESDNYQIGEVLWFLDADSVFRGRYVANMLYCLKFITQVEIKGETIDGTIRYIPASDVFRHEKDARRKQVQSLNERLRLARTLWRRASSASCGTGPAK